MKPAIPEGATVRITHYRRYSNLPGLLLSKYEATVRETHPGTVLPRGGMTQVLIDFPDGRFSFGYARCAASDNFSRSKGRLIATGRALKHMEASA